MKERKIIITKDGLEYGEDLKTLEELLPAMCVSVAYACRALGKNPINAFVAVSGVFGQAKTPEEFGHIKEKKQTNADWIRNMSNTELAEFLNLYCSGICQAVDNCGNCDFEECKDKHQYGVCGKTLEWLEKEREE